MDFKKLKEKALENTNKLIDSAAKKLSESSFTISKKEDFLKLIEKSKTTTFKNKETGEEKQYKHKSIVIIAEQGSKFFKDALYMFPVISAKAFSQNINTKLAISKIEGINMSDYKVGEFPCMIVFEEEKVLKTITGSENILKLVKSFDLDINKLVDEM